MSKSLDQEPESKSEQPKLTPKLSPRWALKASHIGVAAFFSGIFLLFSYLPLRSTDLWGHTLFGHWILEHHELPQQDPFFPLAQGMKVIDSAWLSQVVFGLVDAQVGPVGLSIMFALLVMGTMLVLARTFFLQSGRIGPMLFGSLAVLVVGWSRATTLRPECFGALLFAVLLWLITRTDLGREEGESSAKQTPWALPAFWIGVPLLFCVWANFHGSYLVGLILLGCCAAGRAMDVAWRNKSLLAGLGDANVQRYAFATELALVATLINPYGWELLVYNLTFAKNVNLATVLEWQPLVILGIGGREFALSWVLLLFLWRQSKAKVTATQVLVIAVFGFASVKSMRMLGWYAPAYAWAIAPHVADIWARWLPRVPEAPLPTHWPEGEYVMPPGRSFHFTLVTALVVWLGFSFTPFGTMVVGGKKRTPEQLHDASSSPLSLTAFLQKHPPRGQVFQPQHWGDWFVREVPGFQPFVTSNIHLAPPQVWQDYNRITRAEPGWQRVLDRYNVTTLVLDKTQEPILVQAMKQTQGWGIAYDDDAAVVYLRVAMPLKPADGEAPAKAADDQPGGEAPEKLEGSKS